MRLCFFEGQVISDELFQGGDMVREKRVAKYTTIESQFVSLPVPFPLES